MRGPSSPSPRSMRRNRTSIRASSITSAPPTRPYRGVRGASPDDAAAASTLATLYGQGGEPERASAVFDSSLGPASHAQAGELIIAGERLLGTGLLRPGTRALALGLNEN